MADAAITGKPTMRPAYMTTPQRQSGGSREMKVTWKNPSSATDRNNANRATGIIIHWDLVLVSIKDGKNTLTRHFDQKVGDNTLTSATLNLNAFRSREFPNEIWTRDTFYPGTTDASHEWTKMWCLRTLRCGVYYYNAKGEGPGTITTTNFKQPFATTVSKPEQVAETGHLNCKVTTPKGDDLLEVHSGWWTRTVYDSRTKKKSVSHGKVTRGTSSTIAWDVTDRMQLTYDQYVSFKVEAHTRGYWGNSETRSQTLYVSYPKQPKITDVLIPSKSSSDKVTVLVNTQQATKAAPQHPVTGVRLEVLASSAYTSASQIPANAEWADLNIIDDGECTAISCTVSDVKPEVDTYTWIRIKSWNQIENIFYRYSAPYRIKALETKSPTAAGDGCTINKAVAGKDGTSIVVTTQYDEDSHNTGTELTWSKYKDAWYSTDQPDSFEATWKSNTSTYTRDTTTRYKGDVKITVRGLDPSTEYFFKARRYLDIEDRDRTYSSWSDQKACTTCADPTDSDSSETKAKPVPDSVSLVVPSFTPRGEGIPVTWTFQPDSNDNIDEELADRQTGWELYVPKNTYSKTVSGSTILNPEWVVARGTDARGAYTIPYNSDGNTVRGITSLVSLIVDAGGARDSIALRVRVKTSGNWCESTTVTTQIADVPKLGVYVPTVTVQPAQVEFYCTQQSSLSVVVRSTGACGEMPWGYATQAIGDTIWSGVVTPTWRGFNATQTDEYQQLLQDLTDAQSSTNAITRWCAILYDDSTKWDPFNRMYGYEHPFFSYQHYDTGNKVGLLIDKAEGVTSVGTLYKSEWSNGSWGSWTSVTYTKSFVTSDPNWDEVLVTFPNSTTYQKFINGELALAADVTAPNKDVGASVAAAQEAIDAYLADQYQYIASVMLPDGLDLWDGSTYEVTATATDQRTSLTSDAVTETFGVAWARQAPVLDAEDVTVTPLSSYDADGNHEVTASIVLPQGGSLTGTDRLDVYRVTSDGPYLIYSDASQGEVIADPYAPYGKSSLAYRVAVRTVDGDLSWTDYPYRLDFGALRFDFGSRHIELPYNIKINDSYSKDFAVTRYLDGSIDGFWNAGAMRQGGFTTDLIKLFDRARLDTVRELAHYAGPCFVRTPEGCAFMADVEVNSIGTSYDSLALGISLSVTEVELTSEYMGVSEGA